jgi:hypothetical protein
MGMAKALASGPTTESCWKKTMVSGAMPSVIANWARTAAAVLPLQPCWAVGMPKSTATAKKESQNPGASKARGSSTRMANSVRLRMAQGFA